MPDPLFIDHAQGRTMLKWHRGRMRATDMEFDPARIVQGMNAGASVEVDLVRHAGGGFAVLHDAVLDRTTTGTGRVADCDAAALRALRRRDNLGTPTDIPVALLSDLCASLRPATGALLQLDLKEAAQSIAKSDIFAFSSAVSPIANAAILSGGDPLAVAMLAEAVPGLATGHDPCLNGTVEALAASGDDAGFVARALADAGRARMIYLDRRIVSNAWVRGFDMVAPFQAAGKAVDVWTFRGPQDLDEVRLALRLGADQITTDDPEGLLQALSPA